MAITYLSGQRIQGIGEISGYKGWTTSGSGWSETTSDGKNIVKATNPSYTSSFHGSVYELPETVGSTFLLRWTIKVTSVTAYSSGSHQFVAWLGGLTIDGSDTAMDQTGGVGLNYGTNPSITWGGKVATGELGGGVDGVNSFGTVSATTTKYIEAGGTDTNDYEIRMYSNSDYSDTPTTKSYTNSGFTGSNALKFIRFSGGSHSSGTGATGNITAEFSDVKFWNNQTTASGDPDVEGFADTPSDKSTVTDVPTGSQFEETDTRKFFQCGESTVSGSGLKAYYKLGTNYTSSPQTEANVASTVSGSSSSDLGSNANISIYNQPTQVTSGTPTNLGNANLFDGAQTTSGDYGKAGTDGNKSQWDFLHNTTSKFTFNVWLKFPDSKPENNRFLWSDAKASDSIPSFQVRSNGDPAYFRAIIANSTGNQSVLDTDGSPQLPIPTDDAWHMYTFTWDISLGSDNFTYRVDGATSGSNYKTDSKSGNSAVNTSADTSPLFMGDEYSTSYGRLNSSTCELAIWNRVLTDAEITTLYQDGAGLQLDTGIKVWTERGTAI